MKELIKYLFVFLISIHCFGQSPKIDSLKKSLNKEKNTTNLVKAYNSLAFEYRRKDPDSSIIFSKKALQLANSENIEIGIAEANLWMGVAYFNKNKNSEAKIYLETAKTNYLTLNKLDSSEQKEIKKNLAGTFNAIGNLNSSEGDFLNALTNHKEALKIRLEINDEQGISASYNNLAVTFATQGNYTEALKNHFASLKMKEKLGNKEGMAVSLNNIGNIYLDQGDNDKAIEYLSKALKLSKELELYNITTTCYINIGAIYTNQKKYREALASLKEGYAISRKTGNKENISNALGNIGAVYFEKGNLDEALKNEFEALAIKKEIGDNLGIAAFESTIGKIYFKKGDVKNAILHAEDAFTLSKQIGALKYQSESSGTLASAYSIKGNYKKALEMQNAHYTARDSLQSISSRQELFKQELKYSYDKQTIADSLNFASQKELIHFENEVKLKSERKIKIGLFIGLFIVLVFALFIFNRFKITKKQKDIIELQSGRLETAHKLLESKTKELKDSILYAKEIQNAFLKSPSNSKHWFKDILLVYRPKDVVSGDFYWYKEKNDLLYVAVGDSTGHGVPGAIISVLAIQFFEKTIDLIKDNKSLHVLNEHMRNEFNKYNGINESVNIGLDYSIVCIDKKENKIYISGSGENVLVKNKLNELTAHKFENINIGGNLPPNYEATTVIYELENVQSLFLYTDGIIDQKGFETKKKLGTKKLKDIVLNLKTNSSVEAKQLMDKELDNWIGEMYQIDDITFLGIQIDNS